MNNWKASLIATSILIITILFTQSALSADESVSTENPLLITPAEKTELVSFVDSAVAYAKENGKVKAIEEFNNKTGSFVKGELFIFAIDSNGNVFASPESNRIGKNMLNYTDPNGVPFPKNQIEAFRHENQFFDYYVFPNPAHDFKNELKLAYLKKVDNNWYVGSGIYLSNISATFDQKDKDDLIAYVNKALKFAKENGKQKSLEVFNDPKGNFTRDGRYIFADDYDGRTLAEPFRPELVGSNRINIQDPNGIKPIREIIDVARNGSGFIYYIYPDPSMNMTERLKLSYVTNVDNTWLLGSGIYAK